MTIIAYARFSTAGQKATSIDRQFEAADAYADERGWVIDQHRSDAKQSAWTGRNKTHGELGKILAMVMTGELGEGDTIIVEAIDRLSRQDVFSALDGFSAILRAGIRIVTTDDQKELTQEHLAGDNWVGIIAVMAKMAEAHAGSQRKSSLGNNAWAKRREAGVLTLMPPAWLNRDKSERTERVEIVREVFELSRSGMGVGRISRALNERGLKSWGGPKTSQQWSSGYVSKLLRNRAVLGECQPMSRGVPVGPVDPDYWPRIIDQETFDSVDSQTTRKFNGSGSGRVGENFANLFHGLISCECGRSMNLLHSGTYRYLKCSGARAGACDHKQGYHYPLFEKTFIQTVVDLYLDDERKPKGFGLKAKAATLANDIEVLRVNIEFAIDEALKTKSEAWMARVRKYESEVAEKQAELIEVEGGMVKAASPIDRTQLEIRDIWKEISTGENNGEARGRLHDKIRKLTDSMVLSKMGELNFTLTDGSFYLMKCGRPEGLRIKGKFPLDRMEWKVTWSEVIQPT